jgi:hypothetical protein
MIMNADTRRDHREPVEVTNLDRYGNAALSWSRAYDLLTADPPKSVSPSEYLFVVLGTCRPDGRPHAAPVGAIWFNDTMYFTSGPGTRKSRNLEANPFCTLTVEFRAMHLVFEGEAARVTDHATLEDVVAQYREGGWPATVEGDAFTAPYSAPSAGPPPWYLYRFTLHTAFGVASEEPYGATRWRFEH